MKKSSKDIEETASEDKGGENDSDETIIEKEVSEQDAVDFKLSNISETKFQEKVVHQHIVPSQEITMIVCGNSDLQKSAAYMFRKKYFLQQTRKMKDG